MAYFDVDDPIRKQLAEKYESSGKGPTITVDAVTGETSLGAKKNPTAKDWRDSYENYMRQGGSPLTAPAGMSATRMYQHAVFKGRGMSYYSSEPFESTGFLGEIQQDIAPEAEDEGVVSDSTPTPYIPKILPYTEPGDEENPFDAPTDPGYATGYGTTLAGPEVDIDKVHSSKNTPGYGSLFSRGFTTLGIGSRIVEMLFGDHPSAKASKEMQDKLTKDDPSVFTPPTSPNFKTGLYDPSKPWGDIEGGATPGLPGGLPGSYTGWGAETAALNTGGWGTTGLTPAQEAAVARGGVVNYDMSGKPVVSLPPDALGDDTAPPSAPAGPATGLYGAEPGTEYGTPQGDEDTPGDGGYDEHAGEDYSF